VNAEQLKQSLEAFYEHYDDLGVTIYAILKGAESDEPRKIDIESDSLGGLKELFIESLRDNISRREELSALDLSSSDERIDAIYRYDIEVPEELSALETVTASDDLPVLNLNDEALSGIKALIIEIGNNIGQVVLYKTMAPVNIFGRSSFFLLKSDHRLKKIEDEFLRVSSGFQLARIMGELFVFDLSAIEKAFGFDSIIKSEATAGINAIEEIGLVENTEVLHELLNDIKYARRFVKVAKASPVLQAKIDNSQIISFCKTFPKLANRIRLNEDETKIVLDTKVSKDLFIKLLMDDYLTSELTNFHYESLAKDNADVANESQGID
tara:strand:- start:981 stop:1955 length:975 start_codon:yes stop_codon:yes gene_type:complete